MLRNYEGSVPEIVNRNCYLSVCHVSVDSLSAYHLKIGNLNLYSIIILFNGKSRKKIIKLHEKLNKYLGHLQISNHLVVVILSNLILVIGNSRRIEIYIFLINKYK